VKTKEEVQKSFDTVNSMVDNLYIEHSAGGPLHIVTDDGNVEDHHLVFCYRYLHEEEQVKDYEAFTLLLCKSILHELMLLTEAQRVVWWVAGSIRELGEDPIEIAARAYDGNVEEGDNGGYDARVLSRTYKLGEKPAVIWEGLEQLRARKQAEKSG
jgi:hypothetical protein